MEGRGRLLPRLLRGGAWVAGGRIATGATALALHALLARLVSAEELGLYFLLLALASAGGSMAHLGLAQPAVRLIASALALDLPGRVRAAIVQLLMLGLLLATGAGGLLWFAFHSGLADRMFGQSDLTGLALLAALWPAFLVMQALLGEIWRGLHDWPRATLFGGLLASLLGITVLAAGSLVGGIGLSDALAIVLAALALSLLVGAVELCRHFVRLGRTGDLPGRETLRLTLPLLFAALPWLVLDHAHLILLGMMRPTTEVAVYGAALRLVTFIAMPLVMVNAVLAPFIAGLYARGEHHRLERLLRDAAGMVSLAALSGFLVIALSGDLVLGWVFRPEFRTGATALTILALGQVIGLWFGSAGLTLILTGHSVLPMLLVAGAALAEVGLGLALIPRLGIEGAAAAQALSLAGLRLAFWLGLRAGTGLRSDAAPGRLAMRLRPGRLVGRIRGLLSPS